MNTLKDFFKSESSTPILQILNWDDDSFDEDEPDSWKIQEIKSSVLSFEEGYFLLKGFEVLSSGEVKNCVIDLSMPERISEQSFSFTGDEFQIQEQDESESEFVPSVAIEGFGEYELFYSQSKPEVGIEVLKNGIEIANEKSCIAEDLGYILRDEKRFEEAIKYFRISADGEPSSEYIYGELASLYSEIGDSENEKLFSAKASDEIVISLNEKKQWWKFWS